MRHYEQIVDIDMPSEIGANGADIDYLQRVNGVWWMSVNGSEYAMPVLYCPFCGERLDE
jgi:hypothetical protein